MLSRLKRIRPSAGRRLIWKVGIGLVVLMAISGTAIFAEAAFPLHYLRSTIAAF
jgi:hypothetical protein